MLFFCSSSTLIKRKYLITCVCVCIKFLVGLDKPILTILLNINLYMNISKYAYIYLHRLKMWNFI